MWLSLICTKLKSPTGLSAAAALTGLKIFEPSTPPLIVHKTDDSLLVCYVGHHDRAYDWAERRKLETHPKTGAAQLVEIRETVKTGRFLSEAGDYRLELRAAGKPLASTTVTGSNAKQVGGVVLYTMA
jgi:hypothetical protein